MPPCPSGPLTRGLSSNISHSVANTISLRASLVEPLRFSTKGFASSAPSRDILKPIHDIPAPKHEALTILHKATKIVPRILELTGTSGFPLTSETSTFWDSALSAAHEDLSAELEHPARIAVFATDEWSGATDLVTALLADPLSSDAAQNEALSHRWKDGNWQTLNISHGTNLNTTSSSSVQYPSNFLTQFAIPIEIKESRPPTPSSSKDGLSIQQILESPALFEADIPIIVCNPLTTPLSPILHGRLPSNAIVVLTTTVPQVDLNGIIQQQASQAPRLLSIKIPEIIAVDPQRAIQAIQALQAEPNSLSALRIYQVDFVGSNLSRITQSLRTKLAPPKSQQNTMRTKLALDRISDILRWALTSIHHLRYETDKVLVDASRLRERIEEARTSLELDLFGRYEHATDKMVFDEVDQAIKQTEKEMRVFMDRLSWWRMTWRVDELSDIIGSAVTRTWCHGLERKLILQTGRLSALQDRMTQSGFALLAKHPRISTAILRNSLLQLQESPRYRLTVNSLTHLLFTRRNQIIDYPTMRLHVTGQRAVLGMIGGVFSGVGISWAGWLGWLVGSGEGLLGFMGMEAGTAVGVGMLGALGSVRWAVGMWEKGKKLWWQDWVRVTEGLDRDLKATLHETMNRQIVAVAETAAEGMLKLADSREESLATVEEEVGHVQSGLNDVIHRVGES